MKTFSFAICLGAVCLLGGCRNPSPAPTAQPAVAAAPKAVEAALIVATPVDNIAAAKELFAGRCTPCHGVSGAGDGPASAGLTPKPANFGSGEWQKGVTDEHIEKIILYGGLAVGKSAAMPPNPDLGSKPELVTALRGHLRSLKK